MISNEMGVQISPMDIDLTHRIGVPNSVKNKSRIVKFVQSKDRRQIFTNKEKL